MGSGPRNGNVVELTLSNIVINLSRHAHVDGETIMRTLTDNRDSEKVCNRSYRCQNFRYGHKCSLRCEFRGRCYLAPPPRWTDTSRGKSAGAEAQQRRVILAPRNVMRSRRVLTHRVARKIASGAVGARQGDRSAERRGWGGPQRGVDWEAGWEGGHCRA